MIAPRILIAEDDRATQAFLRGLLERAGYRVEAARDGVGALRLLAQSQDFDAVVLDRRMPRMDGLEVLRHMKAAAGTRDIPVVLATAMGGDEAVQEGLQAGALYYLVKPLDRRLVLQVVGAAAAEHAARKQIWAELEGSRSAFGLIRKGTFQYRTLRQCHDLAALLARSCPEPRRVAVGLSELMINALEHGNLGITYDEKSALVAEHAWAAEVDRRQSLPENRDKCVTVSVTRAPGRVRFRIQDMGRGFRWREFQKPDPARLFDNHGRGILLARWEAFDRVQYRGNGSTVLAELEHPGGD